ncbi:hypothetical protein Tco_0987881 [Tanacetum coccineum]
MSSMQEDIQCAGSDTRPPMLDRTDFESWQQRIRLYCLGKDNGENIMKSIKEGPFQMGTVSDVITGGTEGAVQQGPVRARVLNDLSAEEKERYKADIRATNILLQGIPKDIYSLINHYTDAKDMTFMENEKMIRRGLKESNFDQLYAYLNQHEVHANENRMMMERFIQPTDEPLALVSNASNQKQIKDDKVVVQDVRGDTMRIIKEDHFRGTMQEEMLKLGMLEESGTIAREFHNQSDPQERTATNIDDDVDDGTQCGTINIIPYDQLFEDNEEHVVKKNVSPAKRKGEEDIQIRQSVQKTRVHMICKPKSFYDEKNKVAIGYKNPLCLTRVKQVQPALYNGHVLVMSNHARPVVHDSEDTRDMAEITRKRMLLKMQSPLYDNDRKKAETSVPKPISALTVYPPFSPVKLVPRVLPTKSKVKINLYVLTQLFTEFDKTCKKRITPTGVTDGERGFEKTKRCYLTEVIPFFKTLKEHFVGVKTTLFKEVKIEDLKAQLEGNLKVATRSFVKTKVLVSGMYAIDVKPILHPLKNNRSAHLNYINHLKESVETVREIVEEARVAKPLDNALNYACQYTKLSQELLEYVIGTCPKSFNERDNVTPLKSDMQRNGNLGVLCQSTTIKI